MTIQAIETRYAGCRFRSRLEARWAVFFDSLDVPWEYEAQGYDINGRWYLPDFYLPQSRTYVEVKGDDRALDKELMRKAPFFLPTSLSPVSFPSLMLLGPIPDPSKFSWTPGWIGLSVDRPFVGEDPMLRSAYYGFYYAPYPMFRVDASSATPVEAEDDYADWLTPVETNRPEHHLPIGRVKEAYRAARSARFEHGESGA